MAVKRTKSRGRDLKHTETQAGINVSRYVEGERGRTNGVEKLSAVSAASPKLRRKPPRVFRSPNMTRDDIAASELPDAHLTKTGIVKMLSKSADVETNEKRIARERRENALRQLRAYGDNPSW